VSRSASLLFLSLSPLEGKAGGDLELSRTRSFRRLNVRYSSVRRRVEGGRRRSVVHVIQKIRCLAADLEPNGLSEFHGLGQRQRNGLRPRAYQVAHGSSRIAPDIVRRDRERG